VYILGVYINSLKTNRFFNWVDLKKAFIKNNYVLITLKSRLTYVIPRSAFENNEQTILFVDKIQNGIKSAKK
jgi:hypothetical protein